VASASRLVPFEADVQATILEIARLKKWSCYHTRDSRGSDPGFPDLVLTRDRIVYAELKRQGEKPRPAQVEWLDALARAGGEVYVWTTDDLDDVVAVLTRRWLYEPMSQQLGFEGEWWTPRTLWIPERGVVA
jgi:VRR-NUC domain